VLGLSSGLVGAAGLCRGISLSETSQSSANVLANEQRQPGSLLPSWVARPFRSVTAFASEPPNSKRPVVVCGPSGVGKGTLLGRLLKEYPEEFGFSVSHTTRKPRPGEVDGVHYHFAEKSDMEAMIARSEFIEYAHVHTNIYGTSIAAVQAVSSSGKACLLDIDVQGAEIVKRSDLDARFVFIAPPSYAELERRLRGRGTETEDKVQVRLKTARAEMAYLDDPTKKGFFDRVIVNDDLDKAYGELEAFLRS